MNQGDIFQNDWMVSHNSLHDQLWIWPRIKPTSKYLITNILNINDHVMVSCFVQLIVMSSAESKHNNETCSLFGHIYGVFMSSET